MKLLVIMKHQNILTWFTATGTFLSLGLATASAQTSSPPAYAAPIYYGHDYSKDFGFYLTSEIGPSFMPKFQSDRFGFPGTFSPRPGIRLGVEPGFNFLASDGITLGAEFETGVIYNYLHSIEDAGAPTPMRGDYYQVPLLGNVVLKMHPCRFVTPYVGVGGGGDYSDARMHTPGFFGSDTWDDRIDPAAQAMGGVRFRINSFCDAGIGYKFLADFPSDGKYIATHAALATFTVRF